MSPVYRIFFWIELVELVWIFDDLDHLNFWLFLNVYQGTQGDQNCSVQGFFFLTCFFSILLPSLPLGLEPVGGLAMWLARRWEGEGRREGRGGTGGGGGAGGRTACSSARSSGR